MQTLLKALALLLFVVLCAPLTGYASDLVLTGAKIYPSPTDPPIEHGSILIRDNRILAVGPASSVKIPRGATVIDCTGLNATAGFWNSHVHILTPSLIHADKLSPDQTTSELQGMLTQWGFTTVFDIGSVLKNTNLIRKRIASGEIKGPRILTVGEPFWIKTPIYIKAFLDANHVDMPEVQSTAEAKQRVQQEISDGADGIKIFANSIEPGEVLKMPDEIGIGIVEEAHAHGRPVFAHVSNNKGIELALQSHVDILAHTTPSDEPWSPAFAQRLVAAHMALIPTLTLWKVEARRGGLSAAFLDQWINRATEQLGAFIRAGGDVLFGTDVGYIDQLDTSDEFKWMSQSGMSYQQILASLTTNPAQRFGFASHSGRLAKGFDADLVLLRADPSADITAFSQVQYTIRGGTVIYKNAN